MTDDERVIQNADDSNFRRLGVDVNDVEFRKDYFRYRDVFGQIIGNGNLPTASILEIALRHPKVEKPPKTEVVAKRPRGRPPKKKEPALA